MSEQKQREEHFASCACLSWVGVLCAKRFWFPSVSLVEGDQHWFVGFIHSAAEVSIEVVLSGAILGITMALLFTLFYVIAIAVREATGPRDITINVNEGKEPRISYPHVTVNMPWRNPLG